MEAGAYLLTVTSASKLLVVADVIQTMVPTHSLTRWSASLTGFNGVVGVSGVLRKSAFPDHAATKKSLEQILSLPFERIVVGHGNVITHDPKTQLARAYEWLG